MEKPKTCNWPLGGECACYSVQATQTDPFGRVWMHCEDGLNLSHASMGRFVKFCLENNIEIGSIHPFDGSYPRSQVSAAVCILPEQFDAFEKTTKGKLIKPPRISINSSSPREI